MKNNCRSWIDHFFCLAVVLKEFTFEVKNVLWKNTSQYTSNALHKYSIYNRQMKEENLHMLFHHSVVYSLQFQILKPSKKIIPFHFMVIHCPIILLLHLASACNRGAGSREAVGGGGDVEWNCWYIWLNHNHHNIGQSQVIYSWIKAIRYNL